MTRAVLVFACCCIAAATAALETPLIVSTQGTRMVLVDTAYGAITTYDVNQSATNRLGLGKASANFISDLDFWVRSPLRENNDGSIFVALRHGTTNNKPSYGEMFAGSRFLPEKQTVAEAAAGRQAVASRALKAEDAFWKTPPTYDGVIRIALSSDGRYLAIVVQAMHVLMLYSLDNDIATLAAIRNWGPELFIQVGFNTTPPPTDFVQLAKPERQKELLGMAGLDNPAPTSPSGTPVPLGVEEAPKPKSEVWIGASPDNGFLLVDIANYQAILYQFNGKFLTLQAARNLAIDVRLPAMMREPNEGGWQSEPIGGRMMDAFLASRQSALQKLLLPTTKDEILLLLNQREVKSAGNSFEALFQANSSGLVLLNFTKLRVFLTLNCNASQSLALTASRDYSLDLAMAMLDQEIANRNKAVSAAKEAKTFWSDGKQGQALSAARLALLLDPRLHKIIETSLKGTFREPAQQAALQELLDQAARKTADLEAADKSRRADMDERRKSAKPK